MRLPRCWPLSCATSLDGCASTAACAHWCREPHAASETTDLAETVYRTALNVWPADQHAGDLESIWIAERFMEIDAEDGLYDRYIDLCSKIAGERVD